MGMLGEVPGFTQRPRSSTEKSWQKFSSVSPCLRGEITCMRMLLNWILSAVALWAVGQIVPGVHVSSYGWALVAVIVIGFINATLGLFLKFVTFPLTVFTLGIFWWVINALMLWLASAIIPGFTIEKFWQAFVAAVILSLMNLLVRRFTRRVTEEE